RPREAPRPRRARERAAQGMEDPRQAPLLPVARRETRESHPRIATPRSITRLESAHYSFGSPSGQVGNGPVMSILQGDPFDPLMKLDPDLMIGLEPDADAALNAMKAAIKAVGRSIFLDESDLIIVDNHRAIHGRSKFQAYYDGQDRWLQRMYVLSDLGHVTE